jgi:hypothetical protein
LDGAGTGETGARPCVRPTIGRVDVRAASPVAAPARPTPVRQNPMGLDDYLRRRDDQDGRAR